MVRIVDLITCQNVVLYCMLLYNIPRNRCEVSESFYVTCRGSEAQTAYSINPQLWAIPNRFSRPVPSQTPSTESSSASSIGRSQLYVKNNSHASSITNKVTNSSAKRRAPHQTFPPYSSTTFTSPPFPSEISIQIDHRSEGLLMAKNRRRTRKKRTEQSRR